MSNHQTKMWRTFKWFDPDGHKQTTLVRAHTEPKARDLFSRIHPDVTPYEVSRARR